MKKSTDPPPNFAGAGDMMEAGGKEQEGTSHAQDQTAQIGSDCVASLSAAPLLPCTGNEGNEAHPPIRRVRGLTPPPQMIDGEDSSQSEHMSTRSLSLYSIKIGRQGGSSETRSKS